MDLWGRIADFLGMGSPDIISPVQDPKNAFDMSPVITTNPNPVANHYLDVNQYKTSPNAQPIAQPPKALADLLFQYFPQEASKAATVIGTENPSYTSNPPPNVNANGTSDYGLTQINSGTLQDYLHRFPQQMQGIGVSGISDLQDMIKSLLMMKMIREKQGWGAWYAPANKGYDVQGR